MPSNSQINKDVQLIQYGEATLYGAIDQVNIGSGEGSLPGGTEPLPELMLNYYQWISVTTTWRQFYKRHLGHRLLKLAFDYVFEL